MGKKVIWILAFAMLGWNINTLADTETGDGDILAGSYEASADAESVAVPESGEEKEIRAETEESSDATSLESQGEESIGTSEGRNGETELKEGPTEAEESSDAASLETREESSSGTPEEKNGETETDGSIEESGEIGLEDGGSIPKENQREKETDVETPQKEREAEEGRLTGRENVIYNVLFPASTNAYLDPSNVSGRGQIFSDEYEIENYGNADVAIKIKSIDIQYISSEETYEFTREIPGGRAGVKQLNVEMVWENDDGTEQRILNLADDVEDEYVLRLKAAEYDEEGEFAGLGEGGRGRFYFTGSLNFSPGIEWDDDEIMVSFHYEITDSDDARNIGLEPEENEKGEGGRTVIYERESAGMGEKDAVMPEGRDETGEGPGETQETNGSLKGESAETEGLEREEEDDKTMDEGMQKEDGEMIPGSLPHEDDIETGSSQDNS